MISKIFKRPVLPYQDKVETFFARSEFTRALRCFRRELWAVGLFSFIANILMLSPTLYMLQIYDRVMISRNELTLLVVSLITLFLFSVMAFSEWIRSRLLVRAGVKFDQLFSKRVFTATFESSLKGGNGAPQQALNDLTQLRQFMTSSGLFAIFDAPWSPIYIIVLSLLSPWLGLLALVFALFYITLALVSKEVSAAPQTKAADAGRQELEFTNSKLRNAEIIESLGMLPNLRHRWLGRHRHYLRVNAVSQDIDHRLMSISKFLRYCQQSMVLAVGALLVIDGSLSVGSMIAANILMGRALLPIDTIVASWRGFFSAHSAFIRLETLLTTYPEREGQLTPTDVKGEIVLNQLVATVPNRETPILKGLSATFPAGSITAILGPSGSGKSTLARCLVGVWPELTGQVRLDGEDINHWQRSDLGSYLGYLPQDIELFDGTIAENIARFGEIDPDKVIEAAKKSGMHEMILRFPKGYDTAMGPAGGTLSGGQKQRIGLARAIYGNPAMIVLDEPNANLDSDGEAALLKAVQEMKAEGKTVFLITHRPQIITTADRVLILVDGQIKHYGPRDEVIRMLQAPQANAANASA